MNSNQAQTPNQFQIPRPPEGTPLPEYGGNIERELNDWLKSKEFPVLLSSLFYKTNRTAYIHLYHHDNKDGETLDGHCFYNYKLALPVQVEHTDDRTILMTDYENQKIKLRIGGIFVSVLTEPDVFHLEHGLPYKIRKAKLDEWFSARDIPLELDRMEIHNKEFATIHVRNEEFHRAIKFTYPAKLVYADGVLLLVHRSNRVERIISRYSEIKPPSMPY